jgi:anti-sigma-K factor RskA
MTTTDIHALVGAYVLDAVDDIERAAFERHLRDCSSCRLEVDELQGTAARLADATWSVPPPRLRENVLAEVSRTRQAPPGGSGSGSATAGAGASPGRHTLSRRWLLTAAASVVVAAAAAGTGVYVVQDQRVRDSQAVAEAARSSESRARSILEAPDVVFHEDVIAGGGRMTVASSRLRNAGVVVMAADAAPAGDRVFQLWTIRPGGGPQNAGALNVGQTATLSVVEGLPGASDVAVTVEPRGGSHQPTTNSVADVKL